MIPQAFSNTTFNDLLTPHVGWEDIKSNIELSIRRVSDETRQCNETVPQNMRQMGVANLARRNPGEEDIEKRERRRGKHHRARFTRFDGRSFSTTIS
jgi:hypothetical protein